MKKPNQSAHPASTAYLLITCAMLTGIIMVFSMQLESKFALPKLMVIRIATLLTTLICLKAFINNSARKPDLKVLSCITILLFFFILSTVTSLDTIVALNGFHDRYSGLWTHIGFLVLFLAPMFLPLKKTVIEKIPLVFVIILLPICLLEITERLQLTSIATYAAVTIGNRVPLGAVICFAIPFALLRTVRSKVMWQRIAWGAALLLLFATLIGTKARGPWLGLSVGMAAMMIPLAWRDRFWRLVLVGSLVVTLLVATTAVLSLPDIRTRVTTLLAPQHDESVNIHFLEYGAAWRAFRDYPLLGVGLENYQFAYHTYRDPKDQYYFKDLVPAMVHNGYLHMATTTGLFSLVAYLLLLGFLLRSILTAYRNSSSNHQREVLLAFLAGMIAFLVQDLSGWEDMSLTTVFWLMSGCALTYAIPDADERPLPKQWAPVGIAISTLLILLNLYLLNDSYAVITGSKALHMAKAAYNENQWGLAELELKKALAAVPEDAATESIVAVVYFRHFLATKDPASYHEAFRLLESWHRHARHDVFPLMNSLRLEVAALRFGVINLPTDYVTQVVARLDKSNSDDPRFIALKVEWLRLNASSRHNGAVATTPR